MTKIEALKLLRDNLAKDYPDASTKMRLIAWNDHIKWANGSIGKAGRCKVSAHGYRTKEYLFSEIGNSWSWR